MIIDYSRRTDPACHEGVILLKSMIEKNGYPKLIHFWTKAPEALYIYYNDIVKELQNNGVIVCAQVTINNYGFPLENIPPQTQKIDNLAKLFSTKNIRLRFDPIIIGYTCMKHFKKTVLLAEKYSIERITINFLEPKYKGVGKLLNKVGIDVQTGTIEEKINILKKLRSFTPKNIELAVCAENSELYNYVDNLKKAACADKKWFKSLGLNLQNIKGHYSRKGCGCFYTDDWGIYPTKGGYICPHKCLYCYAKHNLY